MAATAASAAGAADQAKSRLGAAAFAAEGDIKSEFKKSGKVRVLVELASPMGKAALDKALSSAGSRGQALARLAAARDAAVLRHFGPRADVNGEPILHLQTSASFSVLVTPAQAAALRADPSVVSVRLDKKAQPLLDVTRVTMGVPAAWTNGVTGAGRTVVVIDTGVERTHTFITAARVAVEGCFLTTNQCPNGTNQQTGVGSSAPVSGEEHGTHVSGIAMGFNTVAGSAPLAGVARSAKLMSINVFDSSGFTYDSAMTRALEYVEATAIAQPALGIAAVNMSIGGGNYDDYCDAESPAMKTVIERLRARNISVVVAAGNAGKTSAMSHPACLSNVISVGSTNRAGNAFAYYSNVDDITYVLAPGGDATNGGSVISSVIGGGYAGLQGTSMAAPQIAGSLTALKGKYPTAGISILEDSLRRSGVAVTDTRSGGLYTVPRVRLDASRAFLAAPTVPANNAFASAATIAALPVSLYGSSSGASRETGEPTPAGGTGPSVWWKWTAPASQQVIITTVGSNFDTTLGVYTGTAVNALTAIAQNDNEATGLKTSRVAFNAVAGTTYRIAVTGRSGTLRGTVHLKVFSRPANDNFAAARTVTVSTTALTLAAGNNFMATRETGEPTALGVNTIWFKFTPTTSGLYSIDTLGSMAHAGNRLDTILGVYTGTAVGSLTQVALNDDGYLPWSLVTFNATAGTTYRVAVGSYDYGDPEAEQSGRIRLTFTPPGYVYRSLELSMK